MAYALNRKLICYRCQ